MRVGAVLAHDHVRPERGGELRNESADGFEPGRLAGLGLHRHVDDRAGRGPLPHLVEEAAPREQVPPRLMERDRHHVRVVPVQLLDAVPVVDVEVEVEHAEAVAASPGDRQRRVVIDAEPGGSVGHRVMEAAAGVERVLYVAAKDRLHRPDRAARDHRAASCMPGNAGLSPPRPIPASGRPSGSADRRFTAAR